MSLFVNNTVRSADDLLADLAVCRQFRHLNQQQRLAVIDATAKIVTERRRSWVLKHPDPSNPCMKCGGPRSKASLGVPGLCWRCHVTNMVDFWSEDVFEAAIELFGLSCDHCSKIFQVHEIELRFAADRCLDSFEGAVKVILCPGCAQDYKAFCSRNWSRHWRSMPERDIEKMALAWLAQKVKIRAENVRRAA